MFTSEEKLYIVSITVITIGILIGNYRKRDPIDFWSPLTIISLIFFYYVIVGPILAIINNETYFRFTEHREYIVYAWRISLIGFIGTLLGFRLFNNQKIKDNDHPISGDSKQIKIFGLRLFVLGLIGLTIFTGLGGVINKITFWDIYAYSQLGYSGAFRNYFWHTIDFFIPSLVILFIFLINRKFSWTWFLLLLFLALAVYTKEGFRWRYVVLGLALLMSYFIVTQKRPNIVFISAVIIGGIALMGFLGLTRNYGRGLTLNNISGKSNTDIFLEGFGESSIFMTTGLLVKDVPALFNYIHLEPVIETLAMPVPRLLWPGKPSGDYIEIYENLYGSKQFGRGTAVINFGEYFLAFGYWGVFIGGFFLGIFYKRFWNWFIKNRNDTAAIAYYTVGVSYLYVIISRGYLPQVTMLFFFTVIPAYIIFRINNQFMKRKSLLKPS